jgi:hypothetical protein
LGDTANLGSVAGFRDNGGCLTIGDQGGGIGHVVSLSQLGVPFQSMDVLFHRKRFTGKCGFINLQITALDNPQVGRNPVTGR